MTAVWLNFIQYDITDKLEDLETYTIWQKNYATGISGIYLQIRQIEIENPTKFVNYHSASKKVTFTVDKSKYKYTAFLQTAGKTETFNNYTNAYMLYKGTEDKPYEQYGASPSPDYPSEIETVNGSVEIDVVNKNLFPSVKSQSVESNGITLSYNADTQEFHAEGTTTSTEFFCIIRLEELKFLQQNKNYVFSITKQMISNTSIQLTKYGVLANSNIDPGQTSEAITQLDIAKPDAIMLYSNDAIIGTKIDYTFKVQIEEGTTATDFVEHQSQTAIMPIQQEMLSGDYISSVEHHEWKKLILTGEENFDYLTSNNVFLGYFTQKDIKRNDVEINVISNKFLGIYNNQWTYVSQNRDFLIWSNSAGVLNIIIKEYATVEKLKNYLKQQYEAGTPVTIYYKLARPFDLELTAEQKAIRDTKLYTYKNVTNIDVSDKLASIDVEYKKDLETMFNNIIKQMPSSTNDTAET